MDKSEAIKMVVEIVGEVDYDIFKQTYNHETAEEPELVDGYIDALVKIVREYIDIDEH